MQEGKWFLAPLCLPWWQAEGVSGGGGVLFSLIDQRPPLSTRRVYEVIAHPEDFQLAQKCLEGETPAISALQESFAAPVLKFLLHTGASLEEATEVVDALWADCLAPMGRGHIRLTGYNGRCALLTWLNTVALNCLLSRKRTERNRATLFETRSDFSAQDDENSSTPIAEVAEVERLDQAPLLDLMRVAIERAFAECPPEDFVLLQLAHSDGLKLAELARIFGTSRSSIDRQIARAGRELQAATLAAIRSIDPWIELEWSDFVELCRSASPTCFGVVD